MAVSIVLKRELANETVNYDTKPKAAEKIVSWNLSVTLFLKKEKAVVEQ